MKKLSLLLGACMLMLSTSLFAIETIDSAKMSGEKGAVRAGNYTITASGDGEHLKIERISDAVMTGKK